jgi:hypothetical protein
MSKMPPAPDMKEFLRLVEALQEGQLRSEEAARLNAWIRDDEAARWIYVQYMNLYAGLAWDRTISRADSLLDNAELGIQEPRAFMDNVPGAQQDRESPPLDIFGSDRVDATAGPPVPMPPIILDSAPAAHSPLFSLRSPIGGFLFSYGMSAVIVGIALVIGWAWRISYDRTSASSPGYTAGTPSPRIRPVESPSAGRISDMAGCRWSDPLTDVSIGSNVRLGQEYALTSGCLEITYDTGAKVILQGPCTYEVDSLRGGFLSVGRLTARVEKQDSGARGERTANPTFSRTERESTASLAPRSPAKVESHSRLSTLDPELFAIRTPTAVVTDLGTEFGVEVAKSGRTESHVFVGKVKIRSLAAKANDVRETILSASQSAAFGPNEPITTFTGSKARPERFVRRLRPDPAACQRIVEKFADGKLGDAFEQSPVGWFEIGGAAAWRKQPSASGSRQPRGYLRTKKTDFCDYDFVFQTTFEIRVDATKPWSAPDYVFFGMGDGVLDNVLGKEVNLGLVFAFCVVDQGRLETALRVESLKPYNGKDSGLAKIVLEELYKTSRGHSRKAELGPGRHRFQMVKTGSSVRFAVDAGAEGPFQADYVSRPFELSAVVPPLTAANSRLLLGAGNSSAPTVRFEDISIDYIRSPKTRPASGADNPKDSKKEPSFRGAEERSSASHRGAMPRSTYRRNYRSLNAVERLGRPIGVPIASEPLET